MLAKDTMITNIANDRLVFGLDIGTRSIVGTVGYMEKNKYNIIAYCMKEHDTRAMMDGQIHDINAVGNTISYVKHNLEEQIGKQLTEVCIAAAGRVLKTLDIHVDMEFESNKIVDGEDIYSLEMLGVEKAYDKMRTQEKSNDYYCVGYTIIKYYVDNYAITNPEAHKANTISADLITTFLPNGVVEDLYTAVKIAGLEVANLTLEPIAAINVAIPEKFRLLNIALVDVGAGTSDISITKDGSIIAYGMIPHAGDEITETILKKTLVEFSTAEAIKIKSSVGGSAITYKDVLGLTQKLTLASARALYNDTVEYITKEIADKIIELNGGKTVNAVFIVGGGGKAYGFIDSLAKNLTLPKQRVALRGEEVLMDVDFLCNDVKKDPLLVTPIGISLSYYEHRNNFIFVNINNERIKLYDTSKLTVVDAAMQIGFPNSSLFPKSGKELIYLLNGETRMQRGLLGEPAYITVNNIEASINTPIAKNDKIIIKESTVGDDAVLELGSLNEFKEIMTIYVNGKQIICPKFASVNGSLENSLYSIKDKDDIRILDYYTIEQVMQFIDIPFEGSNVMLNNEIANPDDLVYDNFKLTFELNDEQFDTLQVDNTNPLNTQSTNTQINTNTDVNAGTNNNSISVTVNNTPVLLSGKSSYIFVDILDFYPFDIKTPKGSDIGITINGFLCTFSSPINTGDELQIYWKE